MKKTIIFLTIAVLTISCAAQAKSKKGKNKEPEWLTNPKSVYPEQLYLTAIGEGDSRSEAENYAAGNLSKIFEVKVDTDETFIQRYEELTRNEKTDFTESSDVTKKVNLQSGQTFYNLQFSESYTDKLGRVYVLAYLNRFKTGELYEEKINQNQEKISYYLDENEQTEDPLIKYAALTAAETFSTQNEILLEQLDIISPETKEFLELNYNHNEIVKQTSNAAHNIKFRTEIEGDKENKIGILIENLFTELGFVASQDNLLLIEGSVNFEETDLGRDDNYIFVRYDLQLTVKDTTGNVIAALTEKGREGHATFLEAKERCIRTINKKIENSLKKTIINYFNKLIT